METGVSERRRRSARWWLALAVEVATVVGVLIAITTLLLEHHPRLGGGSDHAAATNPAATTSAASPPPEPGPGTPTAAPPGTPTRYLSDLDPDSGGANVQRVGTHTLRMACGSGDSTDPFREVTYLLPPAAVYRSFTSTVAAAGARDTRIQAKLFIDDKVVAQPTLTTGSSAPLRWSGDGVGQLRLRITCDPGATTATLTDPRLSG